MFNLATKDDLKSCVTKEEFHQELHAQTRQFVTWLGVMTAVILGGVYFLLQHDLADIKADLREIRSHLWKQQQ